MCPRPLGRQQHRAHGLGAIEAMRMRQISRRHRQRIGPAQPIRPAQPPGIEHLALGKNLAPCGAAEDQHLRQQQLSPSWSIYSAFSGQWADKNLDSSEKFFLGGSSGVRAYPSSEAGGTLGQMFNVELRWQLSDRWGVAGFYDHGRVTVNKNNDFAGAPALNAYALKGAGLALSWRGSTGLSVQASFARRLGDNPNPITSAVNYGADQDGTLHINRYWLTASMAF